MKTHICEMCGRKVPDFKSYQRAKALHEEDKDMHTRSLCGRTIANKDLIHLSVLTSKLKEVATSHRSICKDCLSLYDVIVVKRAVEDKI